ncbi:hypothetical protein [Nocardia crassostreae]|nr:hypothetical protein [Nocardia crassostreae]
MLEREYRAERNEHLLEGLVDRRSLAMSADEVVEKIRRGREDDE